MGQSKIYDYSKEELQNILDISNSYTDMLHRIGIRGGSSINTLKRIIKEYNLSEKDFKINYRKLKRDCSNSKNNKKDISLYLYKGSKISSHKLKTRLIESGLKECMCEMCKNTEWLGKPIKLHLHHTDGDHLNNELDNLQLLCPNCHSYTDNYGVYNSNKYKDGKNEDSEFLKKKEEKFKLETTCPNCGNKKDRRSKLCVSCSNKSRESKLPVTKDELLNLIIKYPFTIIGEMYNVSDNAVRKWCVRYGLPFKREEMKALKKLYETK